MIILWIFFGIVLVFGLVVIRGAPYVPSKRADLKNAFTTLYPLSEKDLLIDIGSGDGVVLREAARRGARALGYELNPILVGISWFFSRKVSDRVQSKLADFWTVKFPPETTVVYTFGESRDITKMYNKVKREAERLGKELYFISYGFAVPDIECSKNESGFYLYRLSPLLNSEAQV